MTIVIGTAFSQTNYTAEADAAYARGGFHVSAQEYIKAYAKVKDIDEKGRIAFMIGESFRMLMDPGATEEWYDKAIGLRYGESHPEVFLNYGEVMSSQQKFDDAIEWYMAYQENGGDQAVAEQKITAADK